MVAQFLLLRRLHVVCNAEHLCSESGGSSCLESYHSKKPLKGSECGSHK